MNIIAPSFTFGNPQNNFAATPSRTAPGTTVTASATPHTKGAWAQIFATTNYDVWGIQLKNNTDNATGAQSNILLDIGIGAALSEVAIINNMLLAGANSAAASQNTKSYWLPIYIPKGTRVSARIQSNIVSKTTNLLLSLQGGPSSAPWPAFSGADCLGADTATSGGLAHTAGNTGTESTWTNIGVTAPRQYFAIMPVVQPAATTTLSNLIYHVELGITSVTLGEWVFATDTAEETMFINPPLPLLTNIPIGSQMMVRAECSGTGESLQYGVLALY